jgi:hypothetical protein
LSVFRFKNKLKKTTYLYIPCLSAPVASTKTLLRMTALAALDIKSFGNIMNSCFTKSKREEFTRSGDPSRVEDTTYKSKTLNKLSSRRGLLLSSWA